MRPLSLFLKIRRLKHLESQFCLLFCMCTILFPPLREEHRLRLLENRTLRRKLKPNTAEMIREWRKLHNEEPYNLYYFNFFFHGLTALTVEVPHSQSATSHMVGLLLTRDRHIATPNTSNRQFSSGIRTRNPSKRAAADPLLRPRGYRDQRFKYWGEQIKEK